MTTDDRTDVLPPAADVGVLQLDVEGFEEPALRGAMGTITRCLPLLILETPPSALVEAELVPLGYQPTGTVCDNTVFSCQHLE
jgi:hypothetical protein